MAAGGSALVTLRDCAASASMRWGDGDGAGVGVAGGGLNCANFGIFPVNLCNGSISSASSGKESVIFGSGLRSSPSSPCNSAKVAGGAPGGLREEALRP